jgi:hypothetical protein
MAKKKPDRKGKKASKKSAQRPGKSATEDRSPSLLAQMLVEEALENPSRVGRIKRAREALALDPNTVEAYALLAEEARTRRDELRLRQEAVAAAERRLGPKALEKGLDSAKDLADVQRYVQARLALGHTLWTQARRQDALAQVGPLLEMQPEDPFRVRYTLAAWLLAEDRDKEAKHLLQEHADREAMPWILTRSLLAYRAGDLEAAQKLAHQAHKVNRYVIPFLASDQDLPEEVVSDPEQWEAAQYVEAFLSSWRASEGALNWLRVQENKPKKTKDKARSANSGPTAAGKKVLNRLPQETDTWEVDARQMPVWLDEGRGAVRPWALLVVDPANGQVLANDTLAQNPTVEEVWSLLERTMQQPLMAEPHRPSKLLYSSNKPWGSLEQHFQDVGITFQGQSCLEALDIVFPQLMQHLASEQPPGLLVAPGVTPDRVRSLFEAAANFYRQAPWKRFPYQAAIEVQCKQYQGPWYAVIMGQSGLTLGLALYDSLKVLRRLWSGRLSDEQSARLTVGTTLTYGEPRALPIADLEALDQYGWPVARSDAYPCVFHKDRGLSMRPPLVWEMEVLEACLRTLPDFVARRPSEDTTPESLVVSVASKQLDLTLGWVEDKPPPRRKKPVAAATTPARDPVEAAMEYEAAIRSTYAQFASKKPVMLVDLDEKRIYAYPYKEFRDDLSPRGQTMLTQQYEEAQREHKIVVFARDNTNERLVSFSLDL